MFWERDITRNFMRPRSIFPSLFTPSIYFQLLLSVAITMSGDWYPGRVTQAKEIFQDKAGPIGLQLGRARQTYERFPLSNQAYRMLAVGPGAIGPTSIISTSVD